MKKELNDILERAVHEINEEERKFELRCDRIEKKFEEESKYFTMEIREPFNIDKRTLCGSCQKDIEMLEPPIPLDYLYHEFYIAS